MYHESTEKIHVSGLLFDTAESDSDKEIVRGANASEEEESHGRVEPMASPFSLHPFPVFCDEFRRVSTDELDSH